MTFVIYLIRHENRFNCAIQDCSLTSDGLYSAQFELPEKLDSIIREDELSSELINIYCSPTLRTLQTIWFYAERHNKRARIENTIHETLVNNMAHYIESGVPQAYRSYNVYHYALNQLYLIYHMVPDYVRMEEHDVLFESFEKVCNIMDNNVVSGGQQNVTMYLNRDERRLIPTQMLERLKRIKTSLQILEMSLNNDFHTMRTKGRTQPDLRVDRIMRELSSAILITDRYIRQIESLEGKFDFINNGEFILCGREISESIEEMIKDFKPFEISRIIESEYQSILDIDGYAQKLKRNNVVESIEHVANRADRMAERILLDAEYQDAIYVSHALPIASIIYQIYSRLGKITELQTVFNLTGIETMNKNELIEKLDQMIGVGEIHRLRIDLDRKTVIHKCFS